MTKYPSSIQVALYLSLFLSTIFAILLLLTSGPELAILFQTTGFFVASIVTISLVLEFIVYRRLKLLRVSSEREIQKLKELENFRREFIGDISHELKTPIFAISGFIETLLDGAMDDKKVNKKFLQKALKHSERLSNLVEDILTITQIESGDLGMHVAKFSIMELLTETVESLDNKFTKKGRNISCIIDPRGHAQTQVLADRERIQQVLYNLIDNGVKYGDSQGTLKIALEENESRDKVIVKVTDNGPGIQPEHLGRLFERFYRVDKSRSRNKGGTGLGLAICKHLIEAHHEKIWVESVLGKGSTFQFTLKKAA